MDEMVKRITVAVNERFPSFGGGRKRGIEFNPIAAALKDKQPQFAAGVDIEEVVRFVLSEANK